MAVTFAEALRKIADKVDNGEINEQRATELLNALVVVSEASDYDYARDQGSDAKIP